MYGSEKVKCFCKQIIFTRFLKMEVFVQLLITTQQTRYIHQMFDQCWSTVYDVGPTLVKHWIYVSCLLGRGILFRSVGAATANDRSP